MSEIITKASILKKLEYFNDPEFSFDAPSHVYTYKGKKIFGVTSFLERFIKQFDSDYWSKKKADEEGITQEEMLARWDAKRDRSCDLGHMVHDYIEKFYESGSTKLTADAEANERIEKFKKIYEERLNKLESIGSEIRVLSKIWGLAGTIDKLYLWENSIIVGDWKTNAKIKTDKDFAFGKLLWPFDKYKENEINKYSLQISLYQLILEEAGIYSDYGFICHIPSDGEAKIYKLKDFRAELRTYLNHQFLNHEPSEKDVKNPSTVEKLW